MQIIDTDKLFMYCESCTGASHIREAKPCQDSCRIYYNKEGMAVMAVADGHGSPSYDLSQYGSEIAVNAAIKIMSKIYNDFNGNEDELYNNIKNSFPNTLFSLWQDAVMHDIQRRDPDFYEENKENQRSILKRYGTTLLVALLCPTGIYSAQIGDGNIFLINGESNVHSFTEESPDFFSNETASLVSKEQSKLWEFNYKKAEADTLVFLSTDGLYNCFANDEEFYFFPKSIYENLLLTNSQAQRIDLIKNLPEQLSKASSLGSGDDISVAFAFAVTERDNVTVFEKEGETSVENKLNSEI